jgi:hypothetical protein
MPPNSENSAITLSGGRVTRGRKNTAIKAPTPKRSAVTSQPVSMPLPPARETRMNPVQMQMVAVTAIQPARVGVWAWLMNGRCFARRGFRCAGRRQGRLR